MESFSPSIQGENIIVLKWGNSINTMYLRVPVGRIRLQLLDDLKRRRITSQTEAIHKSFN